MKKIKLKNICGKVINVLLKSRQPTEVFEVELPKTNKWTSETYLLCKPQEIANLIKNKYLELIESEKEKTEPTEEDIDSFNGQSLLREYGLRNPVRN